MTRTTSHPMPEPAVIIDRVQFGQALTLLRERAGLTIRDIARSVEIPVATAGDYFAGRTLPPVKAAGVLPRVLKLCGVTDSVLIEEWRLALIRVRRGSTERSVRWPTPYRGLVPYQPADASWLFGRDDLVQTISSRLVECRVARVPLFVTGPAGVGKSSVLRAGLLPAWPEHGRLMTPGVSPCRRLADQVRAALGLPDDVVDHAMHCSPESLETLARARAGGSVLVIDQFEELFTMCRKEWAVNTFMAALSALARSGMSVVIGSRVVDDLISRRLRLGRDALSQAVATRPLTETQLRQAIELPARRARAVLEPGLVETLLADATTAPDSMPRLSHALLMTWRRRENGVLTSRSYQAAGGIGAAVHRSIEQVCRRFTERQRELAAGLFDRLRAGPVTKPNRTDDLDVVVDRFAAEGLLVRDEDVIKVTQDIVLHAFS